MVLLLPPSGLVVVVVEAPPLLIGSVDVPLLRGSEVEDVVVVVVSGPLCLVSAARMFCCGANKARYCRGLLKVPFKRNVTVHTSAALAEVLGAVGQTLLCANRVGRGVCGEVAGAAFCMSQHNCVSATRV